MLDADGEQSVFVIVKGKAEQRHIRTGLTNSGMVEVLEGLKGDEQVVVVGQAGLKTGTAVRVVEADAAAAIPANAKAR